MDPGFSDLFQSTALSDLPKLKIKGFFDLENYTFLYF